MRAVGDRTVGGDHAHLLVEMQPAAEHPDAGGFCVLHHRVRCLGYVGEILLRKVIAPSSNAIRYRVISKLLFPATCSGSHASRSLPLGQH